MLIEEGDGIMCAILGAEKPPYACLSFIKGRRDVRLFADIQNHQENGQSIRKSQNRRESQSTRTTCLSAKVSK